MKKLVLFAAAASMMFGATVPVFAATKSSVLEHRCTVRAKRHHIPEDKMAAYVNACVAKHRKAYLKKVAAKKAAPKAAPAAQAK